MRCTTAQDVLSQVLDCGLGEYYDFRVEVAVAIIVVALFVIGSLIPRIDRQPWQGDFELFVDRNQPIKAMYRIWSTWRLERTNAHKRALTQHFQVLQGGARKYQIRKHP